MGCLLEWILEAIEMMLFDGWEYLMQLVVPRKGISPKVQKRLRAAVSVFVLLLLICMAFGFCAMLSDDSLTQTIGRHCFFIPLGLSLVQILAGIVVRISHR